VVPDDEDTPFESLIDEVERRLRRTRSWGSTVMWVTSVLAAVFSGGMAWAVFVGENTTDAEMHHEIRQAFTRHNGGVDPEKLDDVTNAPVGHHPDMRKAIRQQEEGLRELRNTVLPRIEESQRKLEKRSEYQFELGRWQADTIERQRKRQPPPPKPGSLDRLERDLMLGDYTRDNN
jgi:hypothetical protein